MSPSATPTSPVTVAAITAEAKATAVMSKPEEEANTNTSSEVSNTANTSISNSNIHVSSHPVLFHKITILRSSLTDPGTFRSVLRQVTYHLGYEATQSLQVQKGLPVTVPLGKELTPEHEELRSSLDCGFKLLDRVALIPILRSGLGMTDAMLELLPNSAVHHIGMYRTPGVHEAPVQYYNRLPRGKCQSDVAHVLDPIVGSAATIMAVVSILKKWGVPKIHVITVLASKKGLELLVEKHPEVFVTVGIVDNDLTENGIVLPGMGDVGDRLFGTGNHDSLENTSNSNGSSGSGSGTISATTASVDGGNNTAATTAAAATREEQANKRKRSASLQLEMDIPSSTK